MIEASHALAAIAASRERRRALVVVPSVITMRAARRYLEDHGADMKYVRFVLPDTLHAVRGRGFSVVVVDSYARMQARDMGRSREFEAAVSAAARGGSRG
ncbi:MAG: hypothetical protein QM323_11610 [Acidobacteriota bacterium]|nr:hypothetical protein [Acidobacteriota bacterium]